MKKILISTVAAAMVTSSLMAASSSVIYAGADINGTVQDLATSSAPVDINISATNVQDPATTNGINYIPAIGIGNGNLITVKVDNGYVYDVNGNNLYLADANCTASDKNATGTLVVAKMTDFVSSSDGHGYKEMTFKFEKNVPSGDHLVVVDGMEENATNKVGFVNPGKLTLRTNKGINCGDWVSLSVINSTDQSGNAFNVANAPIKSGLGQGVKVIKALNIQKVGGVCPTYTCSIALPDETSFGSAAATVDCPTCAPSTEKVLTCDSAYTLQYNPGTKGTNAVVTSIKFDLATTDSSAIKDIKSYGSGASASKAVAATLSGTTYATSLDATTGVNPTASTTVSSRITVDGTTVVKPRKFDLTVKANDNVVDTIKDYITLAEQGQELDISYMNDNPAYRTFVRVTSDKAAIIQAVVTTEDGKVSNRIAVTKEDGTAVEIPAATGGAVVVEAADIMRSAKDAGFAGTGHRFNVKLYVKTIGNVDAVAYQNVNGSQRYLPVYGATGGGKF